MWQGRDFGDSRISISKHSEVIPLDIEKRQNYILPTVLQDKLDPSLEAVSIDCIRAVYEREKDVVPQCLKRRDGKRLRSE